MNKTKYILWTVWCIIGSFLTPQWLTITFLNLTGAIYRYDYTMDAGTAEIFGIIFFLLWALIVLLPMIRLLIKAKQTDTKKMLFLSTVFILSALLSMAVLGWNTIQFWVS